ncbi:STAS domain-containing protein [Streptomyces sp. NPDC058525]|uniref:STAS domain-containing protein n=1 Tax=unclassified Streptomyces TaxID=2593676 RepID=UPI00364EC65D
MPILPSSTAPTPEAAGDGPRPSGIDLSCSSHGDILRIHLGGDVDHFSSAPLRVALTAAAAYGYLRLELDTRAVSFCDSALLDITATWCRRGRTLTHIATSRSVTRLLHIERAMHIDTEPGEDEEPGR